MAISAVKKENVLRAVDVQFDGDLLSVVLSDDRRISVLMNRIPWLNWLTHATPQQQGSWSIEPNGFAIYWDQLDDGVEVKHLLEMTPLH